MFAFLGPIVQSFGKLLSAVFGVVDEKKRLKIAERNLEKFKRDHPKKTERDEWVYNDEK